MTGLAFFQYEGIGTLLPVMEASSARESMIFLTIASLVTLFCSHVAFSEMIYYSYGHELNEPIVIFQIPQDNWFVIIAEFLYLGVIIFSFPLNIYITNYVTESLIFDQMRYSELRKWLKNTSRTLIVALSLVISTLFYAELPRITGLIGVSIGTTVVMITPALLNNNLYAKDTCNRCLNWTLIVYAAICTVLLTSLILLSWNNYTGH